MKTLASQFIEHEQYLVEAMKKMLDSRSKDLEQHVTGAVAQLHADLELIHQDLVWVSQQVDVGQTRRVAAHQHARESSLPNGGPPIGKTPYHQGTFETIPVKTPYKADRDSYRQGMPTALPGQRATVSQTPAGVFMPAARPQHPKTHEYPSYDGKVESSHRANILKIDQLKRARAVPDAEIISKLPVRELGWW